MTARHRRPKHAVTWIILGLPALLAADALLWLGWIAWHLLPVLLPLAVGVYGCRRWAWHRRILAWARSRRSPAVRPSVVPGQVVDDTAWLHEENERLHAQVDRLEQAANRPIDAVIASYEVIRSRYGNASVGDTRRAR